MAKPSQIAVYGKGGIGKSTVCANLSAALASAGQRVLQIGCDPKHDSTRLLLGGESIPTVLDYLKSVPKEEARLSAVLRRGAWGIGCIEAGGPKPGVGCAGRGIISAFEFLARSRVKEDYDFILYDVLGDVVCGGFAVPIRREYADAIFLVTSGEFMAIYAANNILRGIRNFDGEDTRRVAGIIYNARSLRDEDERVGRFARAVGLPIVARVPRSEAFARAEARGQTLMADESEPPEREIFRSLAGQVRAGLPLHLARPLADEDLEACVLGGREAVKPTVEKPEDSAHLSGAEPRPEEPKPAEAPNPRRLPLYGCAFNGAATTAVHLTDAVIIAHSPRSCAFYTWQNISSSGRRNLFNRGILMPSAISPNFETTELGQSEAVFGGTEKLKDHVRDALARHPGAVVVISSCVSGIIGDDVASVEAMSTPETPVILIRADGVVNGDYMAGIRDTLHTLARRLIDRGAPPRPMTVNLIGEGSVMNNLDVNYRTVKSLLERMGITIGCRFLGDATAAEVRDLLSAPLNILAEESEDNRALRAWLEREYGCRFLEGTLPVGFRETKGFLERIGAFFGCGEAARPVIEAEEAAYRAELETLLPKLRGKKLLLTTLNANMDWLLDAASAVGMEFTWIGVLNYLRKELSLTEHPEDYPMIEEITDAGQIARRIEETKPDIVLSGYAAVSPGGNYIVDSLPMYPPAGFRSAVGVLQRWALLTKEEREGEWVNDRLLFEKYYA